MLTTGSHKALAFDEKVREDLRLLEVDEALLKEILQTGVVIKGHPDDNAVLVTKNKTYALKYVETTNTQLLVEPGKAADDTDDMEFADENSQEISVTQALRSPAGLQTQRAKMEQVRKRGALMVTATANSHLELQEIRPNLEALVTLLSEAPYLGLEADQEQQDAADIAAMAADDDDHGSDHHHACDGMDCDVPGSRPETSGRLQDGPPVKRRRKATARKGLYTLQQLLETVQASESQVLSELQALSAVELDGSWRIIDPAYLGQLLELLILTCQAEGWPLGAIPCDALCTTMAPDGYRPELVTHCLRVYGQQQQPQDEDCRDSTSGDLGNVWRLDDVKVCKYFAIKILKELNGPIADSTVPGKAVSLRQLMAAWQQAVPAGFEPDVEMLRGEVLTEGKTPTDTYIRLFQLSCLPSDPKERFTLLFAARPQWEATDIEPYLAGLSVPGFTSGALLLKYARASQPLPDGPVYYTVR